MAPEKKDIATQQPVAPPTSEKAFITFGNKIIQRPTSNTSTERALKEGKIS